MATFNSSRLQFTAPLALSPKCLPGTNRLTIMAHTYKPLLRGLHLFITWSYLHYINPFIGNTHQLYLTSQLRITSGEMSIATSLHCNTSCSVSITRHFSECLYNCCCNLSLWGPIPLLWHLHIGNTHQLYLTSQLRITSGGMSIATSLHSNTLHSVSITRHFSECLLQLLLQPLSMRPNPTTLTSAHLWYSGLCHFVLIEPLLKILLLLKSLTQTWHDI